MKMKSKNESYGKGFVCEWCGWEGWDVKHLKSDKMFLRCPDCLYPVCASNHQDEPLLRNRQAEYQYRMRVTAGYLKTLKKEEEDHTELFVEFLEDTIGKKP